MSAFLALFYSKFVQIFFKISFREAYDAEYVTNIKKLPERLGIDPTNLRTMQKLKLKLISQVNLMET